MHQGYCQNKFELQGQWRSWLVVLVLLAFLFVKLINKRPGRRNASGRARQINIVTPQKPSMNTTLSGSNPDPFNSPSSTIYGLKVNQTLWIAAISCALKTRIIPTVNKKIFVLS